MHILAIDLGTSAIKFLRLDEHGRIVALDRTPQETLSVDAWIVALERNLVSKGDHRELAGIAITGQMHGLMTRESDGAWGEGIPWHDDRSAGLISAIREAIGPDAVSVTGGPIAPGFLGASLAWIRAHDAARWTTIRSVHLPKDALIHELTGEHVTDPSDAAGTGLYAPATGDWAWSIVDALGIPREWLPRIMPSGAIVGGLRPEYAHRLALPRGLPIIVAGGDAPVGAFGAGVTHETEALVMLSTGAQVIRPARAWTPDPAGRWYTWPSVAPLTGDVAPYLRAGTLMNAGNVTQWMETVLADGPIGEHPSGLVALPHLIGTRARPDLRGAIVGLDEGTTAGDIRRALLEGVAFSVRAVMEQVTGDAPPPSRIRLGGGLAHRPEVRQLFADVLGTRIESVTRAEMTAYGAGLLALHNLTGQLPEATTDEVETTLPHATGRYDGPFDLYRDLDRALAPFAMRIAALREDRP